MKHFHTDTGVKCFSGFRYFSFDEAVLMSNLYSLFKNFKFGIYFHQKKRVGNFHYDLGIKSRPGSQIFLTLAIL